jgi:hypothetical protein
MHMEFLGELRHGHQLGSLRVTRDGLTDSQQHVRGCGAQPAVPHPQHVDRHVEEFRQRALREGRVTAELAKRVDGPTVPFIMLGVKRPPEYQAGDQRQF